MARGDRRLLDLQPLPLRARLARPAARRRPRVRRSRSPLPRDQLQRRRALPGRLAGGDARAGRSRGRLAASLPPGREPGGGARVRGREDAGRVRLRRRPGGCATAAPPTPTTTIRRRTPSGCATRSTPCSRAARSSRRRPSRSAARSSGSTAADDAAAPAGPGSRQLGQPRAGYDVMAAARRAAPRARGRGDRRVLGRRRAACRCPADRDNLMRAGVREPAARPTASASAIDSEIPLARGLGSSAAAIVAGLAAADHLFELALSARRCSPGRPRSRGIPTTSRRRSTAASSSAARRGRQARAARFDPPEGLEAVAVIPRGGGADRARRARRSRPGAAGRRGRERRPRRRCSCSACSAPTSTWSRPGSPTGIHQPRRRDLYPRSMEIVEAAPELGALGATISGAGPDGPRLDDLAGHRQGRRPRWRRAAAAGPRSAACRSRRTAPTCPSSSSQGRAR